MVYALIWLFFLATSLSLMALAVALAAKSRRTWLVWLVGLPMLLWLSAGAVTMAVVAGMMWAMHLKHHSFPYFLSLAIIEVPLLGWILWKSRGRTSDQQALRGAQWSARWLAGGFALCLVCGTGLLWWTAATARERVEAIRDSAVTRLLEIAPHPPEEAGDDAAPIYAIATSQLRGEASEQEQAVLLEEFSDYGASAVAEVLDARAEALAALRQGAQRPRFYIDYPYDKPTIDVLLSSLAPLRHGAVLLRLSARHRLAKGDVDGAIEDVRTMAQLSRHIAEPPILVHALVALGVDAMAIETVTEVLGQVTSAEQLTRLPILDPREPEALFPRTLRSERAITFTEMSRLGSQRAGSAPKELSRLAPVFWVFWLSPEAQGLDSLYDQMEADAFLPFPEAKPRITTHALQAKQQGLFSSIMAPSLARVMSYHHEQTARRIAYSLAIETTRFNLQHSRWPADSAELQAASANPWPADPRDGAPMRMQVEGNQLTISCVGNDSSDRRGRPREDRFFGDITLTVTRPHTPMTQPAHLEN